MAGRPPTPSALKRLRGETRPSRIRGAEPSPSLGAECPRWLTSGAKRIWGELAPVLTEARVLTCADAVALANLCELQAEFLRQAKRRQISGKLASEIRQYLGRFGLTPADRARVAAAPADEEDPFAEFAGLKVVGGGKESWREKVCNPAARNGSAGRSSSPQGPL